MVTCIICLEDVYMNKKTLQCGHSFHKRCIKKWIEQNNTCPTCRQIIEKDKYCSGCYFCAVSFVFALMYQTAMFIWMAYFDIKMYIHLLFFNTLIIGCVSDYWVSEENCYYCTLSDKMYGIALFMWCMINTLSLI